MTALAVCSCTGLQSPQEATPQELAVHPASQGMTRGYVDGTSMEERSPESLHMAGTKEPRTIHMTAWQYRQSGGSEEYFRNEPFRLNANGETDGLWHHPVPVYWPMGGTLDLMAYSCSVPFHQDDIVWGRGRSTDRLTLTVDGTHTQDDILYSCAVGAGNGSGLTPSIPMAFSHAQAWIEFKLRCSGIAYNNVITVRKIVLEDIYTSGVLDVTHPYGTAEGRWSYRFDTSADTVMDDNGGVYGNGITTSAVYLDMLLPEQGMKDFMLYYTIEGTEPVMQYEFDLPEGNTWQAGKKYIYEITFSPTTITVSTSINDWSDGIGDTSNVPES